ncbi:MAG: ribbon-helix-helix protein, CopG family [Candidatus Hydrogenedentes bacterium]|nr:ribbon-helix-helix protein, CopG family [Candidatus Hydrogenedentota bacterium]
MRTTLTLDDDVAAALERLRELRDQSFKDVVNEALRLGLQSMILPPKSREPFRTRAVELGRCRLNQLDSVSEALAIVEGETFK